MYLVSSKCSKCSKCSMFKTNMPVFLSCWSNKYYRFRWIFIGRIYFNERFLVWRENASLLYHNSLFRRRRCAHITRSTLSSSSLTLSSLIPSILMVSRGSLLSRMKSYCSFFGFNDRISASISLELPRFITKRYFMGFSMKMVSR